MEKFRLKLKGKTAVFIDWANVYGWQESLKRKVDTEKLISYLRSYPQVGSIDFYFGTDNHPKSAMFLNKVETGGYKITTKPVKYIQIAKVKGQPVYRRKCDFDMEICIDVHRYLLSYQSFIFFTGDGDFAPLYNLLAGRKKQVIVIYMHGHLGREIYSLKYIYKRSVDLLEANLWK